MKVKNKKTKKMKAKRISNGKLMFLCLILLFIVFEALYILKGNHESLQASRMERNVAGASAER